MERDIELNPNCSEAIMRISIKRLTEKEKEILMDYLNLLDNLSQDNPNEYEWWYDSYVYEEEFDGMIWIDIEGETPYNQWNELEEYINKLPFAGKLVTQRVE